MLAYGWVGFQISRAGGSFRVYRCRVVKEYAGFLAAFSMPNGGIVLGLVSDSCLATNS